LRVNRVPRAEARERATELLAAVDLAGHAMHRPGELSGGQCQRVAIARALVMKPDLVLADEPTANLDSATGARIVALMHQLQQKFGTAFVIATHDPMVAAQAEQKHTIRDGQLDPTP
jgi:putative ABC transport system ATP-binding protein